MPQSLLSHSKIALDLDGTLIDGPASDALSRFVLDHPEKKFWIVTFRTPAQLHTLGEELAAIGLQPSHFVRVFPMPERFVMEFDEDQHQRRLAGLPRIDSGAEVALFPGESRFVEWKGYVCKRIGATVLVDDMPPLVLPGCRHHGITFIEAQSLALAPA